MDGVAIPIEVAGRHRGQLAIARSGEQCRRYQGSKSRLARVDQPARLFVRQVADLRRVNLTVGLDHRPCIIGINPPVVAGKIERGFQDRQHPVCGAAALPNAGFR